MDSDRDDTGEDLSQAFANEEQAAEAATAMTEAGLSQERTGKPDEDELDIPSLGGLESAASQSKVQQDSNAYFSEAPPPSPEKTRRRRRRTRPEAGDIVGGEDVSRRSGLELEVEELLDNSTQWRKSRQTRIRTPVRRAVLSYGCASPGRRQQVLCDLNAKVRELEVAALSRGIVCSLNTTVGQRQRTIIGEGEPPLVEGTGAGAGAAGEGLTSRLDPRVRVAYQQTAVRPSNPMDRRVQEVAVSSKLEDISSWHDSGRLQSRGRSRAAGLSREATTATTTGSSGFQPRRAKTSFTMSTAPLAGRNTWAAATSVTKADLLRLQTINGEVQRSLYLERTPELRRLLHAGGDGRRVNSIGGICGVGATSLSLPMPGLLGKAREKGSVCPPATATGVSRRLATAARIF